jgi:hypothetical protein
LINPLLDLEPSQPFQIPECLPIPESGAQSQRVSLLALLGFRQVPPRVADHRLLVGRIGPAQVLDRGRLQRGVAAQS